MGATIKLLPGGSQLPERLIEQGREKDLAARFDHPQQLAESLGRTLAPLQRQTGENPVECVIGERKLLRIAAEQASTAATQGGLRQHAGARSSPTN